MLADIAFAPDKDLNIDLQDDDASPSADTIAIGANLIASGSGEILVKASRNVSLRPGSSLVTADGNLTVEANQQTAPTAGNSVGIDDQWGDGPVIGWHRLARRPRRHGRGRRSIRDIPPRRQQRHWWHRGGGEPDRPRHRRRKFRPVQSRCGCRGRRYSDHLGCRRRAGCRQRGTGLGSVGIHIGPLGEYLVGCRGQHQPGGRQHADCRNGQHQCGRQRSDARTANIKRSH